MVKLHMSDKQFYPTRDSCNKKRDPPSGCILSNSSLFHLNMSVQTDAANIVTISGKRDIVISKISFRGNHTYIFDPVELGCSFSLYFSLFDAFIYLEIYVMKNASNCMESGWISLYCAELIFILKSYVSVLDMENHKSGL